MCLIITAFAAVATTIIWYFSAQRREKKLGLLALMYWGASLMWLVDGFFSVAEGGSFLDLSANDALLGLVVVLCGVAAWVVILLCSDPKKVFSASRRKVQ
ncbi:MAG: hypothetical protein VB082_05725 [Christensenella sp.]|nr:hypothetical protein [Christensenella sp.]